jgi:hydroxymethylbilane synthase
MSSPHHRPLRLGTRGSPLALAQAGRIARQLREQCGQQAVVVTVATPGDESTAPIERLGTTGVFTSTLRDAGGPLDRRRPGHTARRNPSRAHPRTALTPGSDLDSDGRDTRLAAKQGPLLAGSRIGGLPGRNKGPRAPSWKSSELGMARERCRPVLRLRSLRSGSQASSWLAARTSLSAPAERGSP